MPLKDIDDALKKVNEMPADLLVFKAKGSDVEFYAHYECDARYPMNPKFKGHELHYAGEATEAELKRCMYCSHFVHMVYKQKYQYRKRSR